MEKIFGFVNRLEAASRRIKRRVNQRSYPFTVHLIKTNNTAGAKISIEIEHQSTVFISIIPYLSSSEGLEFMVSDDEERYKNRKDFGLKIRATDYLDDNVFYIYNDDELIKVIDELDNMYGSKKYLSETDNSRSRVSAHILKRLLKIRTETISQIKLKIYDFLVSEIESGYFSLTNVKNNITLYFFLRHRDLNPSSHLSVRTICKIGQRYLIGEVGNDIMNVNLRFSIKKHSIILKNYKAISALLQYIHKSFISTLD